MKGLILQVEEELPEDEARSQISSLKDDLPEGMKDFTRNWE